jgi:hypothetical protein
MNLKTKINAGGQTTFNHNAIATRTSIKAGVVVHDRRGR